MTEVIDSGKCGYLNALKHLSRRMFGNQQVKVSKTLLKSARQHFDVKVPLTSSKVSCVSCLLVGSEILGRLFNTLTADHVYSCDN